MSWSNFLLAEFRLWFCTVRSARVSFVSESSCSDIFLALSACSSMVLASSMAFCVQTKAVVYCS